MFGNGIKEENDFGSVRWPAPLNIKGTALDNKPVPLIIKGAAFEIFQISRNSCLEQKYLYVYT